MNISVTIGVSPELSQILTDFTETVKAGFGIINRDAELAELKKASSVSLDPAPVTDPAPAEDKPAKKKTKKETTAPASAPVATEEETDDFLSAEAITLETLREKATQKSVNEGKRNEVRALLAKFKAETLGGLRKEDYNAFWKQLLEL